MYFVERVFTFIRFAIGFPTIFMFFEGAAITNSSSSMDFHISLDLFQWSTKSATVSDLGFPLCFDLITIAKLFIDLATASGINCLR